MIEEIFKLKEKLENQFPDWDFQWKISGSQRLLGLCPFHREKHHSFNIYLYDGKAYYRCFSCGARGGLYSKNSSGSSSLAAKLMKTFHQELLSSPALEYFERRGVKKSLLERLNFVGVIPENFSDRKFPILSKAKGWMVFLYTDIHGNPVLFKLRKPYEKKILIEKIKKEEGIFSGMGLYEAFRSDDPFIIFVEGEFDSLVPMSSEDTFLPIVAIGSTTNFLKVERLYRDFQKLGKVPILFPDNDEAGLLAVSRLESDIPVAIGLKTKDLGEECFNRSFREILETISIKTATEIKKEIEFRELEKILSSKLPESLKTALITNPEMEFLKNIKGEPDKRLKIFSGKNCFKLAVKQIENEKRKLLLVGAGRIKGADYYRSIPSFEEIKKLSLFYFRIIINPGTILGDPFSVIKNLYRVIPDGKEVWIFFPEFPEAGFPVVKEEELLGEY